MPANGPLVEGKIMLINSQLVSAVKVSSWVFVHCILVNLTRELYLTAFSLQLYIIPFSQKLIFIIQGSQQN